MTDIETTGPRWRATRTTWIAGAIVFAGFSLMGLSWWFILFVGLGTFGPGLLRELGWLNDKDEFQRRADHRAGYHAFLAAGVVAFAAVAYVRSGDRVIPDAQELGTFFLVLLWFVWSLSSMIGFWGATRAAAWTLRVFGTVVFVFAVVSNLGPEWTGWAALLLHPLLALPFFVLAWLARRRPRISGLLLLAAAAYFFRFFGWFSRPDQHLVDDGVTAVLFLGPLLASGIALLVAPSEES